LDTLRTLGAALFLTSRAALLICRKSPSKASRLLFTEQRDFEEALPGEVQPTLDYEEWLSRGRAFVGARDRNSWDLGDWIEEGDDHFNARNFIGGVPGYMLLGKGTDENGETCYRSYKLPNFYKEISDVLGIAVQTLKNKAVVARAYSKFDRIPQLSFTHHAEVASCPRRLEYLQACLDVPEGERPRTLSWLRKYVDREEGRTVSKYDEMKYVQVMVPEAMYDKLKDLGSYYNVRLPNLIEAACHNAIADLIEQEAQKISLDKFHVYEGKWPFPKAKKFETQARPRSHSIRTKSRSITSKSPDSFMRPPVSWNRLGRISKSHRNAIGRNQHTRVVRHFSRA